MTHQCNDHKHSDNWTKAAYVSGLLGSVASIVVVAGIFDPFFKMSGGGFLDVPIPSFEYDIVSFSIAAVLCLVLGYLAAEVHKDVNIRNQSHCSEQTQNLAIPNNSIATNPPEPGPGLTSHQKKALYGEWAMHALENSAAPALLFSIVAAPYLQDWVLSLIQLGLIATYGVITAKANVRSCENNMLEYNRQ